VGLDDTGSSDASPITKDGTFSLSLSGDSDTNGVSVAYQVSSDNGTTWSSTTPDQASLAHTSEQLRRVPTDPSGHHSETAPISAIVYTTSLHAALPIFVGLDDTGSSDASPITKDGTFSLSLSGDSDTNGVSVAYQVSSDNGTTWSNTTPDQ